ncbi:MAG: T9SS type A sorting domain-containing protein [Bacteroidales bacterium]|nr:T9SS type A sorting domain-containing protein [Bacteroidales bacterium]
MKRINLLSIMLLFAISSFTQEITRGPEPGEIYFTGPTVTVFYDAFYRSTDFGESAVCVDSVTGTTTLISGIIADKTPGGLYYNSIYDALYYSDNYGKYGTWEPKSGGITGVLHAGITEGHIYNAVFKHSEDYGSNFITHQLNNYFGIYRESEIGYNNKAYLQTFEIGGNDTLYFFISYDSFENLELVYKFNVWGTGLYDLSYGHNDGELYYYNSIEKELLYSSNDGYDWVSKNTFFCPNLPIKGITGGRQEGELYMLVEYLQAMGQRFHSYIYHSLDFGETFTVYHPVSIGPDPIYANFIAEDTLVEPGDTVQFFDLSNDADTWWWDFDNDTIVDSYEQNPTHIYQDTGYYSVKLSIFGEDVLDHAIRYDYIRVDNLTSTDPGKNRDEEIFIYPNPVTDKINISFSTEPNEDINLYLYYVQGGLVKLYNFQEENAQSPVSLPVNDLPNGVYFLKINTGEQLITKKIIINH